MTMAGHRNGTFIATKEHRRFMEFVSAVKKHRYIGICFGPAGVGKTVSAQRCARWDKAGPLIDTWGPRDPSDMIAYKALARSRTAFYTPTVSEPARQTRDDLGTLMTRVEGCIELAQHPEKIFPDSRRLDLINLLIIDEAERLSAQGLEHVRDIFDRMGISVILIGMPGLERRLERYPQFYSRIGFAHHYRTLKGDELTFVLTRHWRKLGLQLDDADFTDHQAIASIARITCGNFRLLHRLFVQIERILKINELSLVTDDVVEAARSTLVIGAT